MLVLILCGLLLVVLWGMFSRLSGPRGDLDRLPGPPGPSWWATLTSPTVDHAKVHLNLTALAKTFGPIIKIPNLTGKPFVMVSNFDDIYKVFVTSGKEFSGRSTSFIRREIFQDTGVLHSTNADATWKLLRQISQRHLRQFGDGMRRIQSSIMAISNQMIMEFKANDGKPFDPQLCIFDAILNNIAFLICGVHTGPKDPIVAMMREYEGLGRIAIPGIASPGHKLLDAFPLLRYFGVGPWKAVQRMRQLEVDIWKCIVDMCYSNPDAGNIYKVFDKQIADEKSGLSPTDASKTAVTLLFAGVITTNNVLHAGVNILAHHQDIQDKILEEIRTVQPNGQPVTIDQQSCLPYTRAVLYELLRYTSVVPLGAIHRTVTETTLRGFVLPPHTHVITNLWYLHHDPAFWGNPHEFCPERFLDPETGLVLPADHPRRTHLMPFGAGTRVCVGETLALSRLFLLVTSLVQRCLIQPAPGNLVSSISAESYVFSGTTRSPTYEVIVTRRDTTEDI